MKQDALKQPFFASLLESQNRVPAPQEQVWPGTPTITRPFFDQDPGGDQTHKYPSDSDEEGTQV